MIHIRYQSKWTHGITDTVCARNTARPLLKKYFFRFKLYFGCTLYSIYTNTMNRKQRGRKLLPRVYLYHTFLYFLCPRSPNLVTDTENNLYHLTFERLRSFSSSFLKNFGDILLIVTRRSPRRHCTYFTMLYNIHIAWALLSYSLLICLIWVTGCCQNIRVVMALLPVAASIQLSTFELWVAATPELSRLAWVSASWCLNIFWGSCNKISFCLPRHRFRFTLR